MSNVPTQVQYWIDQLDADHPQHVKDNYKKLIEELIIHCQETLSNYTLNSVFKKRK